MADLQISKQDMGDIQLVAFVGPIDAHTGKIFEHALSVIRAQRKFQLIFDFTGVSHINSKGLGALLELRQFLDENAGAVVVLNPIAAIRKSFQFLGLDSLIPIVEDKPTAVRELVAAAKNVTRLQITKTELADILLIELRGGLNALTSKSLQEALAPVGREKGFRLIVDLSEVSYVDSSGLGVLMNFLEVARENSGRLVMVGVHGSVKETFRLLELGTLFALAADRPSALKLLAE